MDLKLVSFVVPVYNVEKYLKQCLDSLVFDDGFDYEIIIVNDGSTDNSEQIIKEFQQEHLGIVKYIKQDNRGLSAARNRGIDAAEGKYISFIDSDDFIHQDKYLCLLKEIRLNEYDFIIGNYYNFYDGGKTIQHSFNNNKNRAINRNNLTGREYLRLMYDYFNDSFDAESVTQIYSSNFLNNNHLRFFEGILHEDTLFMFEVLRKAKSIGVRDIPFYAYRIREGSIMHSINEKHYKSLAIIVKRILEIRKIEHWNFRSIDSYLMSNVYEIQRYSLDMLKNDNELKSVLDFKNLTFKAFIKKQIVLRKAK